jgi:hypothetical protein
MVVEVAESTPVAIQSESLDNPAAAEQWNNRTIDNQCRGQHKATRGDRNGISNAAASPI